MSFSSKQKALAIIPKVTGGLSFLGSSYILQDVVRSSKKRKSVYHRLILGLSSFDIMASAMNILSTWPIPRGTPGVFGAVGTTGTCSAQGFFAELGNVAVPVYNAVLVTYYVLIIKNGWSEKRIKKIEWWLHAIPQLFGWTLGILGLGFKLYNNSGWLCWFAPLPTNCHLTETGCLRGQYAPLFRWVHYAVVWGAIVFVTVGMLMIYLEVLSKEKATKRFTRVPIRGAATGGVENPERKQPSRKTKSRRVAHQSMLFVSALYLTWIFTTLTRIFQITHGRSYYPLLILMAIFFPLQGWFNALIYLRPRYLRYRAEHPDLSHWRLFIQVLTSADGSEKEVSFFSNLNSTATRRLSLMLSPQQLRRWSMGVSNEVEVPNVKRYSSSFSKHSDGGADSDRERGMSTTAANDDTANHPAQDVPNEDHVVSSDHESDKRSTSVTWENDVAWSPPDENALERFTDNR